MKEKQDNNLTEKNAKKQKSSPHWWKWPLVALIVSLTLSFVFSVLSQYALSETGIAVSIIVIILFIVISIIFDMIGVAVTAAKVQPFRAMASKKVRGAKQAIKLIRNAEKVSSICTDIIGDICSILAGAAGSAVAAIFIMSAENQFSAVLIASAVSAVIAGLTVFGKAMFKKYAITNNEKVTLIIGKILSFFETKRKQKPKVKQVAEIEKEEKSTIEKQKDNP